MNQYQSLLKSFLNFMKNKGRVSFEEMISWCRNEGIEPIILVAIIDDLKRENLIAISSEEREIAEGSMITIPVEVSVKEKPILVERRRRDAKRIKSRRRVKGYQSILKFLKKEEIEEKVEEKIKEEGKEENKESLGNTSPISEPSSREIEQLISKDSDLYKAIQYLNRYWSVGDIRFIEDLKRNNVKDPEKVLKELLERGYVERHPLGVLNATDKLPQLSTKKSFAEMLA